MICMNSFLAWMLMNVKAAYITVPRNVLTKMGVFTVNVFQGTHYLLMESLVWMLMNAQREQITVQIYV